MTSALKGLYEVRTSAPKGRGGVSWKSRRSKGAQLGRLRKNVKGGIQNILWTS